MVGGYIMSVSWYPEIDIEKCNNCRACYDLSSCGVFEVVNDRVIVAYPEECTWECTKCGKICPKESIQYQFIVN